MLAKPRPNQEQSQTYHNNRVHESAQYSTVQYSSHFILASLVNEHARPFAAEVSDVGLLLLGRADCGGGGGWWVVVMMVMVVFARSWLFLPHKQRSNQSKISIDIR